MKLFENLGSYISELEFWIDENNLDKEFLSIVCNTNGQEESLDKDLVKDLTDWLLENDLRLYGTRQSVSIYMNHEPNYKIKLYERE